MRHLRPAIALLLACCGSNELIDAGPVDAGVAPRLRVVQWVPEAGGAELPVHFFDPRIGTDCVLRTTEDGQTRCLPQTSSGGSLYADPACEEPAISACSDADVISLTEAVDCIVIYRAYRRGAPISETYRRQDGACVPTGRAGSTLTRIPDEALVAGDIVTEPATDGARLSPRIYAMADGTTMPTGRFWDETLGASCVAQSVDGDEWPCVPSASPARDGGACGAVAVVGASNVDAPACTRDYYVETDSGRETGPFCRVADVRVYQRGAEMLADRAMTCDGVEAGDVAYELTPAPPLAMVSRALRPGEGRLRRYPSARAAPPYRDMELEIDCEPMQVDGQTRCMPWAGPGGPWRQVSTRLFEDSECSVPVGVGVGDEACAAWFIEHASEGECPVRPFASIHRATGLLDEAYERADDGSCVPAEVSDTVQLYSLQPMPFDAFARLERVEL